MSIAAQVAVFLIAALHFYFLVLEMFLWETDRVRKIFRSTPEFAKASKVLAANQGLYNGFLAAGLMWSVFVAEHAQAHATFFLACVIAAGAYAAFCGLTKIIFVQSMPAALALALVWLT